MSISSGNKSAPTRRVTLSQLAEHTGLGIATVSDIINRGAGERYSSETRDAVYRAAEMLGYTPIRAAQQLVGGRSGLIGVLLMRELNNPFYSRMAAYFEKNVRLHGFRMQIATNSSGSVSESDILRQFQSDAVEGAIIGPSYQMGDLSEFKRVLGHHIPTIFFGAPMEFEFDEVALNNVGARKLAIEFIVSQGHRKIGYLSAPSAPEAPGQPWLGFDGYQVLLNLGLADLDWMIWRPDMGCYAEIEAACQEMLQRWEDARPEDRPTAIICHNDQIAMVAISVFSSAGVRIPKDLSIIGYDNLPESKYTVPKLTTIDFHLEKQAKLIVDFLVRRIQSPHIERQARTVEPTLILRESVRKIN